MKWVPLLGLAFWLGSIAAPAQLPPIDTAPPSYVFPDWTRVEETPKYQEFKEVYDTPLPSDKPENNRVPLNVFIPKTPAPHPAVLILHYWGAVDLKIERELARNLADKGIASAIMTLPYHLERSPAGYRSGALALSADTKQIRFFVTEAVLDARRALDFLASRPEIDPNNLGLAGTSLGSLISSIVYAVDTRPKEAAFVLGGVDLANIFWNSSRVVPERETMRRDGYTEAKLRDELQSIEPRELLPRRKSGSSFVVGAKFDTVIPHRATEELIHALPNPKVLWIDTGHYGGIFVQARLMREVASYFSRGFLGLDYYPPRNINSPTVRLGAEVAGSEGFDISVGVDFMRRRDAKAPIGSLLLTPRGGRIFLGQGIDRSVSIGILLSPKRVLPAILWSVVL